MPVLTSILLPCPVVGLHGKLSRTGKTTAQAARNKGKVWGTAWPPARSEGEKVLRVLEQRVPCSLQREPQRKQMSTLQPMEDLMVFSSWREAHAGAGSWQEMRSGGDPCWSMLILKDCIPWEGPVLEHTYPEGLQPKGRTLSGALWTVSHGRDPR